MLSLTLLLSLTGPAWQQPGLAPIATPVTTSQVADAMTLRDGKVILGLVVESQDRRAPVMVLVRRAWAEANLPEQATAWEKAEAPSIHRAESTRRERLLAWRRSITPATDPKNKLTPGSTARLLDCNRPRPARELLPRRSLP